MPAGGIGGRCLQIGPVIGAHKPAVRRAVRELHAEFLKQGEYFGKQCARLIIGDLEQTGIGQHKVIARDVKMHWLQTEPGALSCRQSARLTRRLGQ